MRNANSLLIVLLLFGSMAVAQTKTVTGKVIHQNSGNPVAGVSILPDTQKGAVTTGADGTYSITMAANTRTLEFSHIGFTKQIITIDNRTTIDITLTPETIDMNEVIVIGYGTQ